MSSIKRKQLGVSIEEGLLEKLDSVAEKMRRTRSQSIETLICEYSINKEAIISEQAQKIKELESELILLKSDTVALPEVDKGLIEQNEALQEKISQMEGYAEDAQETINRVVDQISGTLRNSINEIADHE